MDPAAGQFPHEPRVYRAEKKLTRIRLFSGAGDVVKYPFDFSSAEICVDLKTCFFSDRFGQSGFLQPGADRRGPAALPYYRVENGAPCRSFPYDRRFTLIGDADSRDLFG
jgi:hypothetical protein